MKYSKESFQKGLWELGKVLFSALIVALTLLQFLGQQVSEQVATEVAEFARPGTVTPTTKARATASATPVQPSPTATFALTLTPGVATNTPMPVGGLHNANLWHAPSLEPGFRMTHGVNPNDYVSVFGSVLVDYLAKYGEISYPWRTADENLEYGFGHHTGYVWIYDHVEGGCALFDNDGNPDTNPPPGNCVTDVLVGVHTDGTLAHLRKRFHSHYVFMRACDTATLTQCGIVATGGWVDYGILEVPYKQNHCPLPGFDPAVPPGYMFDLNQPPYRTSMNAYKGNLALLTNPDYLFWDKIDLIGLSQNRPPMAVQFWSGLRPNADVDTQAIYDLKNGLPYPQNMPNQTLGVAWSSLDAWGIIETASCADPELDVMFDSTGHSALNNTSFQIFTISLYAHPAAPATEFAVYWTNRWGLLVEGCTVAAVDCVPFYVSAGTPDGGALLNRQVDQGNATIAPIHEFEVPGGGVILPAPLLPPGVPMLP